MMQWAYGPTNSTAQLNIVHPLESAIWTMRAVKALSLVRLDVSAIQDSLVENVGPLIRRTVHAQRWRVTSGGR